jgi:hypothetical protein
MTEFLSKDPQKALDELKEILYERMEDLKETIEFLAVIDADELTMYEELRFLQNLLDMMERS